MALAPGTALAHGKHQTKVYKGTFTLVGADGDYVTGNFGKAQLVDNKRNDKLSVHVRRVAAKTTYTYKLSQGVCREGAAGGADVAGFKYKPLKTNRKGVGNSTARSRTFTAKRDVKYSVVVYAGGDVVLCAQLRTKYWHGKPKHDKPKPRQAASSDKPHGQARTSRNGKSDDAPGQADDKPRGKSDESRSEQDAQRRRPATTRTRASRSGPRRRRGPPPPLRRRAVDGAQSRAAVSSQRCSAAWPVSVTSPSASIQSRTRSSRTRPSASLGPGPSPLADSALVPGSIVQRPESSAASARPWSSVGTSSGSGPAPAGNVVHGVSAGRDSLCARAGLRLRRPGVERVGLGAQPARRRRP